MNTDYVLGALASVVLHFALWLVTAGPSQNIPPEVHTVRASSLEVVALDAEDVRRLLEPDLAPPLPDLVEAPIASTQRPEPDWPEAALPAPAPRELLSALVDVQPPEIGLPLAGPVERLEAFQPILVTPAVEEGGELPDPATSSAQSGDLTDVTDAAGAQRSGLPELADVQSLLLARQSVPYPTRARRLGIEGITRVQLEIAEDGRVTDARVLRSSGSRILDRAALEAVRKWRFNMSAVRAADLGRRFLQDVRFSLR